MAATVTILGEKEITDFFRLLPIELTDRVMTAAHKDAAKPLIEQARQNAPLGPAKQRARAKRPRKPLRESIRAVSGGSFKRTNEVGLIHIAALRKNPYGAFHAGLVEFGTKNRPPGGWYAKFPNAHKTSSKAIPFMKEAYDAKIGEVRNRINDSIGKKVVALMKRTVRKAGGSILR